MQTLPVKPTAVPSWNWRGLLDPAVLVRVGLKILAVLVLAWLAYAALGFVLRRIERAVGEPASGTITVHEQRVRTIVGLVRSVALVFILLISLFTILGALGLPVGPLLAGAGVLGLAISFGAQSLVKDVISGLFILFENQFAVGDVVRIGSVSGRVERITLRIVTLRDVQGVVHIVPNGEITQVSNTTRAFSRAVLEIGVAYKEDVDRVIGVLKEIGAELWADPAWRPLLVEEITVPGIEGFGASSVDIRVMATTVPLKQWDVARELRLRIKRRFDAEGIEIPFPHQTVYWGEGQKPGEPSASPASHPAPSA